MTVLFVEYPKCSTCKKAKAWLDEHGVEAPCSVGAVIRAFWMWMGTNIRCVAHTRR